MKESSKITLGVIAVLLLGLLGLILFRQPAISDQDQIAAQIESARAAANAHNIGGIMNIVSADFKGPDPISNVDSLNFFLHRVFSKTDQVQITMSPPSVVVQGDSATSTSQVTVNEGEAGQTQNSQPLTLLWRREDGHRFLVFPIKVWRVVGVQYQGDLTGLD